LKAHPACTNIPFISPAVATLPPSAYSGSTTLISRAGGAVLLVVVLSLTALAIPGHTRRPVGSPSCPAQGKRPLENQIIVDPNNAPYLAYNRDRDQDGKPDLFSNQSLGSLRR